MSTINLLCHEIREHDVSTDPLGGSAATTTYRSLSLTIHSRATATATATAAHAHANGCATHNSAAAAS